VACVARRLEGWQDTLERNLACSRPKSARCVCDLHMAEAVRVGRDACQQVALGCAGHGRRQKRELHLLSGLNLDSIDDRQ